MSAQPNIVLVHGAWADGSSWSAVVQRLQADGLQRHGAAVPGVLARGRRRPAAPGARPPGRPDGRRRPLIRRPDHDRSRQDAPNVVALVYIAAFGLDEGESIGGCSADGPPTPALANLDIDEQGFAWLPEDDFVEPLRRRRRPVQARVMHAVQQPVAASTFEDVMGVPAWKSLPSWFLVAETTRPSRPMPSASSPSAWGRRRSKSRPATWRWSPIPTTSCSSSRLPPRQSRPKTDRRYHRSLSRTASALVSGMHLDQERRAVKPYRS